MFTNAVLALLCEVAGLTIQQDFGFLEHLRQTPGTNHMKIMHNIFLLSLTSQKPTECTFIQS